MRTRIISLALSVLMLVCLFPAAVADEQDGWSVIGNICETNWDTDFPMTETEPGVWTSGELGLHEGEMLKVRFGGDWSQNYGIDWDWGGSDPVVCEQDGRNLVIPADDVYTVTLTLSDPVYITLTNSAGETVLPRTEPDPEPFDPFPHTWTVIGTVFNTEWDTDFQMTETASGVWQAGPWALHAGEEFRVRADCDWEVWSYGTESGDNCVVEEDGTYFITLDLNNDPIVVTWELTDQDPEEPVIVQQPDNPGELVWAVIGSIFGTMWDTDFQMTETASGVWQAGPWALHAGEEFKVRANCDWNCGNYGTEDGDNCVIEEDGTYIITLDLNNDPIVVMWELTDQDPEEPVIVQQPDDPGDDPDYPYISDEDIDPATAFNSAGDDQIVPDRSEWPAAPEYDGSLDGIPIDEAHFPDEIFRAWILRELEYETQTDEETGEESYWLTGEQRWNVTVIGCRGLHIHSVAGIEYFPNLEWLYCGRVCVEYVPEYAFWTYASNPITEIDLSQNPKLERLYLGYCKLTEIDLSHNPNLTHLSVFGNLLTELDLSNNGLIEELDFGCNDIRSFDPSQVPNLTVLRCYFTCLAGELDLSGRPQLTELRCCNIDGNNLTSLNISGCTGLISTECEIYNFGGMTEFRCRNCGLAELQGGMGNLQILDCGDNPQFTSLDLSDYRELKELYCDNCNLYRLDIALSHKLTIVNCSNNHLKELQFTLVPGTAEYGGEFYGHGQSAVCASGMEPEGDVFTFDMANLVSSDHLDRILNVDGAAYDPDTGIATFAEAADTIVYTYRTQPESATFPLELTVTVTLNVDMPDLPADAIPIDAEHFPDENFRAWILKSLTPYYTEDAFGRQYLTETRYDALYFGMDGWSVASLEGLQYFPNAFSLMCGEGYRQNEDGDWIWHAGGLTEVDFSQNPNLVEVYLTGNQLETIDVSCLPILQWLGVKNNRLTAIDVSTNYNLAALYCSGNNLTSMTLPGQTVHVYPLMRGEQQEGRLTRLECEDNALEALDLSMQSELKEISCEDNNLTALDLSDNERIGLLDCDDDVAITLPEGMSICAQMTINDGEKTYQCTSLAAAIDKITGRDGVTNPDEVQSAYITVFEDLTGSSLEFAADQQKTVVIDLNGHTYTANSEPALIAYENDVTVINGEILVNPVTAPTFETHSLVLSGQIGVKFYMDLSMLSAEDLADTEKTYMTFTISGKGTVSSDPVPVSDNQMNADRTLYSFTCYVNAIQMADTITATFHYGDDLTVSDEYSIEQYITSFDAVMQAARDQEETPPFDTVTEDLVHALADYGHYMQLFLAGTKGWTLGTGDDQYAPMDTYYTDSYDFDSVTASLSSYAISASNSDANIKSLTFAVVFDSEMAIRLTMKPVSGFTGALTVLEGETGHTVELKSGRWMYEIANIPAHQLGDSHTIKARTGDTAGDDWSTCMTIGNVSVMSYALQMLQRGNDAAKDAGASLYAYWQAAVAFKGAH